MDTASWAFSVNSNDKQISTTHTRGPFEKFVDLPQYSESEFCEGSVTVFFAGPPKASETHLTTLHPLLENVLQTVCLKLQEDSGTGNFDLSRSFLLL
jgi:hypothetical protein